MVQTDNKNKDFYTNSPFCKKLNQLNMVDITYVHNVHILPDILQRSGHSLLGKTAQRTKGHKHQVEKKQYLKEKYVW